MFNLEAIRELGYKLDGEINPGLLGFTVKREKTPSREELVGEFGILEHLGEDLGWFVVDRLIGKVKVEGPHINAVYGTRDFTCSIDISTPPNRVVSKAVSLVSSAQGRQIGITLSRELRAFLPKVPGYPPQVQLIGLVVDYSRAFVGR